MLAMRVRDSRGGADPQKGEHRQGAHKTCTVNLAVRYGGCEMTGPDPCVIVQCVI